MKFTCQGRPRAVTLNGSLAGPEQPRKVAAVAAPMPRPDSPLPGLRLPATTDDVQMPAFPVTVSVSLITPDFAVASPPGWTVHVLAVLADVAAMLEPAAMRARTPVTKAAVRVRISTIPS